ncbi:MAG TPA: hypothetical protein VFH68_18770 [Polyangia bacterium]|jgi:hypothetical protein|nr:hypothetical protein [Polyangia bacterium]
MQPGAAQRYLRQIALPEVGPDGQERLAAATVAVAGETGGDLAVEIAARYLAAGGVGALRLIGAGAAAVDAAVLRASNPDVVVESVGWPGAADADADADADGRAWLAALAGVGLVVRSGFDDDPMLRATVRLGIPVVLMRALDDRAEVLAVRRQGPCPHVDLAIPRRRADGVFDGPAAVVAGTLGAAEAMSLILLIGGRAAAAGTARARHLAVPLAPSPEGGEPRAQDIPWTPECFACGGGATEMVFS